jgi:hypothetical protein
MESLKSLISWATARISERSTWDGTVIVGLSVLFLVAAPVIKYVAWAGIVYGAVRIYHKETQQ